MYVGMGFEKPTRRSCVATRAKVVEVRVLNDCLCGKREQNKKPTSALRENRWFWRATVIIGELGGDHRRLWYLFYATNNNTCRWVWVLFELSSLRA